MGFETSPILPNNHKNHIEDSTFLTKGKDIIGREIKLNYTSSSLVKIEEVSKNISNSSSTDLQEILFTANLIVLSQEIKLLRSHSRLEEVTAADIKLFEDFVSNDEVPAENLCYVTQDGTIQNLTSSEIDVEEAKRGEFAIVANGKLFLLSENEEIQRAAENQGLAYSYIPQEMQNQFKRIINKSVEKYLDSRLELKQKEEKDKALPKEIDENRTPFAQRYPTPQNGFPVMASVSEHTLLNFNSQILMESILSVEEMIKTRHEEEKLKESEDKKSSIIEEEIRKAERREEIKQSDIQKMESSSDRIKDEISEVEKTRSFSRKPIP